MTRTIADIQTEIIDEFSGLADWEDRYREIIRAGKNLPPFPEELREERYQVKGCQSQVWLHAALTDDGRVEYQADSDAHIVRGLLALVVRAYSGHSPDEIIATPPDFVDGIGLSERLSQNRAFGLQAVLKQVRLYALALKSLANRG